MRLWLAIFTTIMACGTESETSGDQVTETINVIEKKTPDANQSSDVMVKECDQCTIKNICRRQCGDAPVVYKGCCSCPSGSFNTVNDTCPNP